MTHGRADRRPSLQRRAYAVRLLREPRLAAVLLIGLVAHLLLMASPVHAAMLAVGMAEPGHAQVSEESVAGLRAGWTPIGAAHSGHCTVAWSSPDEPILKFLGRVGMLSSDAPLLVGSGRWRPRARALGPPQQVDRQALLQVFRL
jgi:hypothetical protein